MFLKRKIIDMIFSFSTYGVQNELLVGDFYVIVCNLRRQLESNNTLP